MFFASIHLALLFFRTMQALGEELAYGDICLLFWLDIS